MCVPAFRTILTSIVDVYFYETGESQADLTWSDETGKLKLASDNTFVVPNVEDSVLLMYPDGRNLFDDVISEDYLLDYEAMLKDQARDTIAEYGCIEDHYWDAIEVSYNEDDGYTI